MRRALQSILALILLLGLATPVAAAEPNPITCEGYPEQRVRLATQDWWNPIPTLGGTGHVHLETCFPVGQTISGTLRLDLVVVWHNNAGTLWRVKGQDDKSKNFLLIKPNISIPGGDGERIFTVFVNTALMPDGFRLMRFYADIEHANGNLQTARAGWPLDIENGKTDSNGATPGKFKFQNWYRVASPARDWGYTGPDITPKGGLSYAVKCNTSTGIAIDRTFIHLNPDFHNGDDGTIIKNVAGAFNGTVTLPAGSTGRMVVRCQQVDGSETHEGVGSFPLP